MLKSTTMPFILFFVLCLFPELSQASNKECLFERPFILGASVSAGHGTSQGGAADVLVKMLNSEARIDNKAIGGASSVRSISNLNLNHSHPTVVLGLDLFFWDAARNECGHEFEKSTKRFFDLLSEKKIPMIIGKVPTGVKFPEGIKKVASRSCTAKINSLLEKLCTPKNNCLIYDPADCIEAMGSPLSPGGKRYFSDALHTTDEGNLFCARHFIKTTDFNLLKCSVDL